MTDTVPGLEGVHGYATLQSAMDEQSALQRAFPVDKRHPAERSGPELADYIRTMTLACISELMEAIDETKWKTWAADQGAISRDGFASELIDALQFLMNLFAVAGFSERDILDRLFKKHQINWKRINEGTNGKNKCWLCKRALDDDYVTCTPGECRKDAGRVYRLP